MPNVEDRRRVLHLLVTLLPRSNRDTMEVLFVFLRWVASFSYRDEETGSKMDLGNLATVITPSILYAKSANAAKDESFIGISAVQELLEAQDDFYHVPNELLFVINEGIYQIFAKELDLPPKEIHRHCAKYMQARGPQSRSNLSNMTRHDSGPIPTGRSDPRLSAHRSDGTLSASLAMAENGERGHGPGGGSQFRGPSPSGTGQSRPTSWIQNPHSHAGSQQSLHQALGSPSSTPWRGPFQGSANGSRQSSRGSAPSSPGPGEERERRSFQAERERAWTPTSAHDHR